MVIEEYLGLECRLLIGLSFLRLFGGSGNFLKPSLYLKQIWVLAPSQDQARSQDRFWRLRNPRNLDLLEPKKWTFWTSPFLWLKVDLLAALGSALHSPHPAPWLQACPGFIFPYFDIRTLLVSEACILQMVLTISFCFICSMVICSHLFVSSILCLFVCLVFFPQLEYALWNYCILVRNNYQSRIILSKHRSFNSFLLRTPVLSWSWSWSIHQMKSHVELRYVQHNPKDWDWMIACE